MPFFRKSIITSIHSSFCVLQSPKWYTGSYPLTFRPLLGKCLSLHNCTGFRDKLLQKTFRWRPVDVLAARCSELSDKWQGLIQDAPELPPPNPPVWMSVIPQSFQDCGTQLQTAPLPHAHPQAHPPSAGLHPWAANGLSTCLRLNICLKSSYPEWDWVWA